MNEMATPMKKELNDLIDLDQLTTPANKSRSNPPGFWIEISPLPSTQKYKEADIEMVNDSLDSVPVEVMGEIRLDAHMCYWVRHENDIIYRHAARTFKNKYPDLLTAYSKAKATGSLPQFDPDSTQVHPKDRIRRAVPPFKKGPPRGVPKTNISKHVLESTANSSEDSGSESDSEDNFEERSDVSDRIKPKATSRPTRRSNRNTKRSSYEESHVSPVKTRTSARIRQSRQSTAEVEDEDEDEIDDLESNGDSASETAQPSKRRFRSRLSRPAYGNIRLVADLSENESDDDYPLHAHRNACDKCQDPPAHTSLNAYFTKLKKKTRGKRTFPDADEEERMRSLGGWVRCLKCSVGVHWKCLSKVQRDDVMKAAKKRVEEAEKEGLFPRRVETLGAYDTTDFFCNACIQGGVCMYCKELVAAAEESTELNSAQNIMIPDTSQTNVSPVNGPSLPSVQPVDTINAPTEEQRPELLFRCQSCKRLAHYAHLPQPEPNDLLSTIDLATHYQETNDWRCTDCISFVYQVDKILAWRPYPTNATEPARQTGSPVDHKALLPREYLVKWIDRSYRRVDWVPHMWLLSTSPAKLKNFLAKGPKVTLLDTPSDLIDTEQSSVPNEQLMQADPNSLIPDSAAGHSFTPDISEEQEGPPGPSPDADRRIPPTWRTVDRVLDVRIWNPSKRPTGQVGRSKRSKQKRVETESESESNPKVEALRAAAYAVGKEPDNKYLESIDEWETRNEQDITVEQTADIIWAYVKWSELGYEDATWDAPPQASEPGYAAYKQAFELFLRTRQVSIKKKSKKEAEVFDNRPKHAFEQRRLALTADPEFGQKGKLMDFQLAGVNWLFRNWWKRQPSILADDMGLGKTVQIATFVGYVVRVYEACPVLIVVPNSTITNWLREFASWAPHVIVVPYYGESKSRDIIRRYQLFHEAVNQNYTPLKFHVLIATYESAGSREFSTVFKCAGRWELLIVDEAQRLKNDAGLLFKRLNDMNSIVRVLMTGTPLNNNLRELFNLMNFLDPKTFNDPEALEKEYVNITEDNITALHEKLKPYFLRRTKSDVLKLPPKNEVIVPLSMSSLQKELYKSLLSKNVDLIRGLVNPSKTTNTNKMGLRNILMDLRKCLQHPYLVNPELEPQRSNLTPALVHKNLVDASCKLRFLQMMLPKLKARGHRVLLFSQFVIALDIIEDFLKAEGYRFLRLDGNTKQLQRQKDMDAFNQPNSEYFVFMLSTRAGGVGVNLWSADTVIIFDPDFNPHQDLQAVSRAHRYGQEKTVLVFKFIGKGTAEERIMQTGKKKLALDHLIVQTMDEEDVPNDLQSILTFGAKALFEESEGNDISYTEADVEKLILRTEQEGDEVAENASSGFGFAKLWTADKDVLEEIQEDAPQDQDTDFWDAMLAKVSEEQAKTKAAEVTGRGARRRATTTIKKYVFDSPEKPKIKKRKRSGSHVSDNAYSDDESSRSTSANQSFSMSNEELDSLASDIPIPPELQVGPSVTGPTSSSKSKMKRPKRWQEAAILDDKMMVDDWDDDEIRYCGLCSSSHGPGECFMSQNPLNLVEYRRMIISESTEPIHLRRKAISSIDSALASRGFSQLTQGQEIVLVKKTERTSHKRKSSPSSLNQMIKVKKHKVSRKESPPCIVCNGPFHLIRSCPVVKAGPESISAAIKRLVSTPNSQPVINLLKDCLLMYPSNT